CYHGYSFVDGFDFPEETVHVEYERWFLNGAYKRRNGKTGSNNNSTNRSGVKIGGQSVKPNFRYVPKASISVPQTGAPNVSNTSKPGLINALIISKNQPSKANDKPSSSSDS
ncbi:hypothetical protein Tco_0739403, partial [Tanacetum coccineum]